MKLKQALPALKPRNIFAVLVRRRRAGRHLAKSPRWPRPKDEVDEWLHSIRSAGM
ncbi:hypothetical protein ABIC83_002703 [Roseateles asaccharophilus]|uniref:hypothetical protein n=1 Tax=Roseateles asaccharophilus TaxID=582607 RepID=UPI003836E438